MGNLTKYSGTQLLTIRNTVAADTNDIEFDLFMEAARSYGLDPFRRQVSAIVFNKDKADKRRMAIIVGRDGLRSIAQRCGDYRPASSPAEFVCDDTLKSPANPLGIVSCGVTLYKQDKGGDWFPVYGEAYWDEFAPIKDEWAWNDEARARRPTGQKAVDGNWQKMPRLMLQKCAEAQALRAGWPDAMGSLYAEEELDQARMKDVTPSEAVEQEKQHKREAAAGVGAKSCLVVWDDSGVQDRVPVGAMADKCLEFINDNDAETVYRWRLRNTEALREFWAHAPNDALEVKRCAEAKTADFAKSEA